jgi:2-methylcitrate dehydratase PrpD
LAQHHGLVTSPRQRQIKAEQITKVEVVFPRFEYINRPQPETGLDGKFSVQYTTAVALLDGEITVDTFNNERRFAPDVVALLPKVTLRFDDSIPSDFDRMHIDSGNAPWTRLSSAWTNFRWIGSPLALEQRLSIPRALGAC